MKIKMACFFLSFFLKMCFKNRPCVIGRPKGRTGLLSQTMRIRWRESEHGRKKRIYHYTQDGKNEDGQKDRREREIIQGFINVNDECVSL